MSVISIFPSETCTFHPISFVTIELCFLAISRVLLAVIVFSLKLQKKSLTPEIEHVSR